MKIFTKFRKAGCLGSIIKTIAVFVVLVGVLVFFFAGKLIVDPVLSQVGRMADLKISSSTSINFLKFVEVDVRDFYIKNPENYTDGNALSFSQVRVGVSVNSVILSILEPGRPIIIDEVRIIAPKISYEKLGLLGNSNIDTISKKFQALSSGEKKEPEPKAESDAPARRFIIKSLVFENGLVEIGTTGTKVPIPMPSFSVSDIGGEKGATAIEAVGEILYSVTEKALVSVGKEAINLGSDALKTGGDKGKEVLKDATDALKDTGDALNKALFGK